MTFGLTFGLIDVTDVKQAQAPLKPLPGQMGAFSKLIALHFPLSFRHSVPESAILIKHCLGYLLSTHKLVKTQIKGKAFITVHTSTCNLIAIPPNNSLPTFHFCAKLFCQH